jgi:hypothetical protein
LVIVAHAATVIAITKTAKIRIVLPPPARIIIPTTYEGGQYVIDLLASEAFEPEDRFEQRAKSCQAGIAGTLQKPPFAARHFGCGRSLQFDPHVRTLSRHISK